MAVAILPGKTYTLGQSRMGSVWSILPVNGLVFVGDGPFPPVNSDDVAQVTPANDPYLLHSGAIYNPNAFTINVACTEVSDGSVFGGGPGNSLSPVTTVNGEQGDVIITPAELGVPTLSEFIAQISRLESLIGAVGQDGGTIANPIVSLASIPDGTATVVTVSVGVTHTLPVTIEYQLDGTSAPWVTMAQGATSAPPNMAATQQLNAPTAGAHSLRARVTDSQGRQVIVGPETWTRSEPPTGGGGTPIVPVDKNVVFDGTNAFPLTGIASLTGNHSVRLGFTPGLIDGASSAVQALFGQHDADAAGRSLNYGFTTAGKPKAGYFTDEQVTANALIVQGQRAELEIRREAGDVTRILLNGTEVSLGSAGPFLPTGTVVTSVGGRKSGPTVDGFTGTLHFLVIDNVQIDVPAQAPGVQPVPVTTAAITASPAFNSRELTISATNTPTGYLLSVDGGTETSITLTSGKYTVTGLGAGQHTLKVTAVNANGRGNSVSVPTTVTDPAAPASLNLRLAPNGTDLLINQQGTLTVYKLARSTASRIGAGRVTTFSDETWVPSGTAGVLKFTPTVAAGSTVWFGVFDPAANDWSPKDTVPATANEPSITKAPDPNAPAPGGGAGTFVVALGAGGAQSPADSWSAAVTLGMKNVRCEVDVAVSPTSLDTMFGNYASRGIRITLLVAIDRNQKGRPTTAEVQNVRNLAARFGPGGTFWANRSDGAFAMKVIEFGNEISYSYKWDHTGASDYAGFWLSAYNALQQANTGLSSPVGLTYEMGSEWDDWYTASFSAIPTLASKAVAWVVHPYGRADDRMPVILDRMFTKLNAVGGATWRDKDVYATEWGVFTNNGSQMVAGQGNWYGFAGNLSYSAAKDIIVAALAKLQSYTQIRGVWLYQGTDQGNPSNQQFSEFYYGLLTRTGGTKAFITPYVQSLTNKGTL